MEANKIITTLCLMFALDFHNVYCREFAYNGVMGPEHWGEQFNSCGGKHQSPININILDVVNRAYSPLQMTRFGERPAHGELLNNGHTVVVNLKFANGLPTISGGPLEGLGTFEFSQFHFHWGENNTVGSEDRINNVSFPAELHVVFHNKKYPTLDEAALKSDGVAVMAFFYSIQETDNSNYGEFCDLLEYVLKPGMHADFLNPPMLHQLISEDTLNYYTYIGSLTTPPCSEDVTWIDFSEPIMISGKQIERFRKLYTHDGVPLTHNFRPIQPLNNRTVYKAMVDRFMIDPMHGIPFIDAHKDSATRNSFTVLFICLFASLAIFL